MWEGNPTKNEKRTWPQENILGGTRELSSVVPCVSLTSNNLIFGACYSYSKILFLWKSIVIRKLTNMVVVIYYLFVLFFPGHALFAENSKGKWEVEMQKMLIPTKACLQHFHLLNSLKHFSALSYLPIQNKKNLRNCLLKERNMYSAARPQHVCVESSCWCCW